MTTGQRIDLDQLEHEVSIAADMVAADRDGVRRALALAVGWSVAEHIVRCPALELALVARIRELEAFAARLIDDHVRHVDETEMRALLEQGVVLP